MSDRCIKKCTWILKRIIYSTVILIPCIFVIQDSALGELDVENYARFHPHDSPEQILDFGLSIFERYTFQKDNKIEDLFQRRNLVFSFLDTGWNAHDFDDLFNRYIFKTFTLEHIAHGDFSLDVDIPDKADVAAILYGEPPAKELFRDEWVKMGVPKDIPLELKIERIFNGRCYLGLGYQGGRLKKAIAVVITPKTDGSFLERLNAAGPIIPSACLLAGIEYYAGLHNIGSSMPDEIVETEGAPPERFPQAFPLTALEYIYDSGAQDGDSRAQAIRKIRLGWAKSYQLQSKDIGGN